jgi:hypothetical protein
MTLFSLKHRLQKNRVRDTARTLLGQFEDPLDAIKEAKVKAFETTGAESHEWSRVARELEKTMELQH